MDTNVIDTMLKFDPLQAAEDLTGRSYKQDSVTEALGFALMVQHGQTKAKLLEESGDSTLSNELKKYKQIISEIGFEPAASFPFQRPGWGQEDSPVDDVLFVYAHRQYGIVLVFDSYCRDRVNGGNFFYCWRSNGGETWNLNSSGSYESETHPDWRHDPQFDKGNPEDLYWAGSHDCREAIRHKISALASNGNFLPKWPTPSQGRKMSGFYLMTGVDWKNADIAGRMCSPGHDAWMEKIFTERYEQFPGWLKEIVGEPNLTASAD